MPTPTLLQQLALCAFLAVCSLSIPARQWLRSGAAGSGGSRHPEWATDPWIRRWINEQEIKQRTTERLRGDDRLQPALTSACTGCLVVVNRAPSATH